jgi:hypothetical protein
MLVPRKIAISIDQTDGPGCFHVQNRLEFLPFVLCIVQDRRRAPQIENIEFSANECRNRSANGAAGSARRRKKSGLLYSFSHPFSPWSDVAGSFRAELIKNSPRPIDLYEVSLDTGRFKEAEDERPFVDYIRALLSGRELDLIVPVGGPATFFVKRHRELLGLATPMMIVGADRRRISSASLTKSDIAVVSDLDLPAYLENILRVQPETKHVAVVVGNSPVERYWTSELRHDFQSFADRVDLIWFNDLTFDEMLKRAKTLPPQSAILWVLLSEDAAGIPYSEDRALGAMRSVATAPIFGIGDYELGRGIVGGPLLPAQSIGREVAEVGLRILMGESPSSINAPRVVIGAPTYDWRELRRWGISEARLPAGSTVLYREPTVWEQYRWQMIAAAAIILLQSLLITYVLLQNHRRRIAEMSLKESEERVNFTAASANLGMWQFDRNTNELWATEHCRIMFGLTGDVRKSVLAE